MDKATDKRQACNLRGPTEKTVRAACTCYDSRQHASHFTRLTLNIWDATASICCSLSALVLLLLLCNRFIRAHPSTNLHSEKDLIFVTRQHTAVSCRQSWKVHIWKSILQYQASVSSGREALIDESVDSRHLPGVGGDERVHFFGEKVIKVHPFLLWHTLDSDQGLRVRVIAPEARFINLQRICSASSRFTSCLLTFPRE